MYSQNYGFQKQVTSMSKTSRFKGPFKKQHGKWVQNAVKI